MPKEESFFINRVKSVGFALRGALLLIRTEASIKVQVGIAVIMTIAGFYFNISNTEWAIQILTIAAILGAEGLNTAIEKVADFIQPEFDKKIGIIKDVSAGAVMLISTLCFKTYQPKLYCI